MTRTGTAPAAVTSKNEGSGMIDSLVIYDGPSMINGAPIVAIVTRGSSNIKTGEMDQLWILAADVDPITARREGLDVGICGGCVHAGRMVDNRRVEVTCYVRVHQAPRAVFDGWMRGIYPAAASMADIRRAGEGRVLRLGAYGDPAAIPAPIVRALVSRASGWTGYTHQWRSERIAGALRDVLMASCDTPADVERARRMGWSTFTVVPNGASLPDGLELCANSRTGVTCKECLACDGRGGRHIGVYAHGTGAGYVNRRALPLFAA